MLLKCRYGLWVGALALSGCIDLGPSAVQNVQSFQWQAEMASQTQLPKIRCALAVTEGYVAPAYRSSDMAYQLTANQVNYFVVNRWQAAPSAMLVNVLAQVLQKTNGFKAVVVVPPNIGAVDRVVNVNVLALSQVFESNPKSVYEHVNIQLVVTKNATNTVESMRTFELKVPVAANPTAGVDGANQALQQLLPTMVDYIYSSCVNKNA
jgi:ABC-type uncharacterized transport system auxiliary subunit